MNKKEDYDKKRSENRDQMPGQKRDWVRMEGWRKGGMERGRGGVLLVCLGGAAASSSSAATSADGMGLNNMADITRHVRMEPYCCCLHLSTCVQICCREERLAGEIWDTLAGARLSLSRPLQTSPTICSQSYILRVVFLNIEIYV